MYGILGKSFSDIRKDYKNNVGLVDSIFSGNLPTSKDINAVQNMVQAMKNGANFGQAFRDNLKGCTDATRRMVIHCRGANGNLSELADSMQKSGISAKLSAIGMNLLSTALNIGLTFAVTTAIQLVYQFVTAQKQLQKAAAETGSAFAEKAKDIDEYKTKIAELQKTINDSSSSYQESYNAREQLLTIQDEIIEKYGKEKGAVDAVTEAIKGNITALDEFTQKSWQETVNDFDAGKGENFLQRNIVNPILNLGHGSNSKRVYDSLENAVVTFHMTPALDKETQEKFDNLLKDTFNASIEKGMHSENEYTLSGDLDDIYDKLLNIQSVAENMGFKDSALSNLKKQASDTKEALEQYDDFYSQHILNDKIRTNEDYLDVYNEIEDAYKKYSDAFKSGDTDAIEKAKQEYAEVIQAASNSISDQSVLDYFNKMHSDLQAIVGTWEFEVKFKASLDNKGDTFDEKIQDALSKFDNVEEIKHFESTPKNNQEQIEAYAELTKYADAYGLSVDQLISELEKLGQIQSVAKQDLLNNLNGDKSGSSGIDTSKLDKDTTSNWINSLTTDEAIFINDHTKEFTDAINERIKNLGNAKLSAEDLAEAYKAVQDSENDVKTDAPSFADTIAATQKVSSELNKLDKIRADIKDKGTFDYSSLIDEDFVNTFGGFTEEYNNFVKTVTESPDNISKCQGAFDTLIKTWLTADGTLGTLTEDTLDYKTKMLESQGVTNASTIVQTAYIKQLINEDLKKGNLTQTTIDYIKKIAEEKGWTELLTYANNLTTQSFVSLEDIMAIVNNTNLSFSQQISALYELAGGAEYASASIQNLYAALSNNHGEKKKTYKGQKVTQQEYNLLFTGQASTLEEADAILSQGYANRVRDDQETKKKKILDDFQEVQDQLAGSMHYTGGDASNKTGGSKGSGGSGKDSDSGKDEFTDWFDLYIKEREEYIEAAKNKVDKLQKELERALKLGDEESIKTIGEQLAVANADYQKVISDSASELRSKMQNSPAALPLLFSLAPELKDIKIDDWTPRLIQKIKDSISDDTKASTFETLTSTIKKAYDYVGDKNGEGSWAQDFADAYSTVDDMLGNIFDKWKDGQDKIIDGIDKQIDKVDDLIDGYDDTIDRIENMNALQGDSIENVLEEASAYNGKLLAYQQKDAKLQEQRIALLNKQKEIELQIQNIKSYGLNDLETVETLQKLNDELDSTNEELVEVGKNISDNNKDALSFFKEIQDAIVDKLKEIYELQKEQAEDALDKSQEKRKKDLEDQQDAALKALEDEKQAAIDASEATSDKLQEELDLLQKRNDELKDATEYYDKLANLQKIYRDKSHAYIDETTGKEVLTYDREAAKEAEADLEDWLSDKVYNNAVDNLQDQIDKQKDYTDQLQDEYDKRIDALKEAQEKETEALEKTLEKEKEAFDEYWDQLLTDERLNAEARALIQEHGAAQALEGVNKLYKDTVTILDSKKQDLYNKGEALSNKFLEGIFAGFSDINKGVSDAIDSIFKNRDWSVGLNIKTNVDTQTASDTLKQMYDNSLKWKEADIAGDTATKISLAAENQKLGKIIGADYNNGFWTIDGIDIFKNLKDSASQVITLGDVLSMSANNLKDSNTALSTEVGKSTLATIELSKTQDANREEIIKQMYANSQAWKAADEAGNAAEKKIYSDANKELAEKIGATWNTKTWGWDIDGKNIYDSLKDKTEESAKATEKNTDSVDNSASATTKLNQTTSVNNNNVSNNTEEIKKLTEKAEEVSKNIKEAINGSNKISAPTSATQYAGSSSENKNDSHPTSTKSLETVLAEVKKASKPDKNDSEHQFYIEGNYVVEKWDNGYGSTVIKKFDSNGKQVSATTSKSNASSNSSNSNTEHKSWEVDETKTKVINNGDGTQTIYKYNYSGNLISKYTTKKKHDGIKSGLIGDNKTLTSKEDILRRIATGELKPDEQLVIAKKAEGIFTPTQMENLANALFNGYNLNLANTAKAPTLPNITPISTQTIEKGDTVSINTLNVTTNDFDTLMRQIRLRAGRV